MMVKIKSIDWSWILVLGGLVLYYGGFSLRVIAQGAAEIVVSLAVGLAIIGTARLGWRLWRSTHYQLIRTIATTAFGAVILINAPFAVYDFGGFASNPALERVLGNVTAPWPLDAAFAFFSLLSFVFCIALLAGESRQVTSS